MSQCSCYGRQHCSEMSYYEEAKYFLQNYLYTKMDGNRDANPCERQCNTF
ncbi:excalibur calcium-binding domain-containing protein [Colwellia sp. PAMC 20917]